MNGVAAIGFTAVTGLLVAFQLCVAFGAPWGRLTWGGQHPGRLPRGFRAASAASALISALLASIVLDRAGLLGIYPAGWSTVGAWIVFGYLTFGVLLNLISRSEAERAVMTPVALALATFALIVAIG